MAKRIEGVTEKLLECAKEEFLANGYENTSLRVIAEGLGFSCHWDGNTNSATLKKGADTAVIVLGSSYYTVNGVDYCHIIDPETLMPARGNLSTSILCESSALADVLSTTLFMMDSGQALALIEETDGCEAVIKDESGNVYSSSGFGEFVNES